MVTFPTSEIREIPEYAAGEVPSVASFKIGRMSGPRKEAVVEVTCRSLNGRIVEPVTVYDGSALNRVDRSAYESLLQQGEATAARSVWPRLQHMAAALTPKLVRMTKFDADPIRADIPADFDGLDVVENFRDAAVRGMDDYVARCAFIGGHLHIPGSEPVYVRLDSGRIRSTRLDDVRSKVPATRIWRADDSDPFLEYLTSLPNAASDRALERDVIDVHRSSHLSWDRASAATSEAAFKLLGRFQRRLQEVPREVVLAWLELRETLAMQPDVETLRSAVATLILVDGGVVADRAAVLNICEGDGTLFAAPEKGMTP